MRNSMNIWQVRRLKTVHCYFGPHIAYPERHVDQDPATSGLHFPPLEPQAPKSIFKDDCKAVAQKRPGFGVCNSSGAMTGRAALSRAVNKLLAAK